MRRFFLIVLICLLPLRAWAGDTMALQMAQTSVAANSARAPQPALALEHSNCHGQATADDGQASAGLAHHQAIPSAGADGAECSTCSACDLCHATGLPIAQPSAGPQLAHSQQSQARSVAFHSTDVSVQFKPPIP